jgi:hypothetical protein
VQSDQTTGPAVNRKVTYTDKSTVKKTAYLYRIIATNVVGEPLRTPHPRSATRT